MKFCEYFAFEKAEFSLPEGCFLCVAGVAATTAHLPLSGHLRLGLCLPRRVRLPAAGR